MPTNLGAPLKLTDELITQICTLIKGGVFGHVAAQACGVSRRTYFGWMAQGAEGDGPEPYASFAKRVTNAKAIARSKAELRVAKTDPATWLLKGPGRHRQDDEGWTHQSESRVELTVDGALTDEQFEREMYRRALIEYRRQQKEEQKQQLDHKQRQLETITAKRSSDAE
jgi:hypothetical protein